MRIGFGTDVHAYGPGDSVVIAGVRIAHTRGVIAHSDGDVALHALCDALLGAAGLGDIGMHFPDTDPRWKGADSRELTRSVMALLHARQYAVVNADITILATTPRIGRYRAQMCHGVAQLLGVDEHHVNIKATTTEGLGFIGRSEGLAAQAAVLIDEAAR
ncbi:MAG TPA: 2-C-methyl-D-erythritol 2,4-cyclodiphosphate synthase [Steroidobacteraceae bacterium]|nr:2-C-methyl-D-erythritol 2,4-cyclodiphosphate synthase [Steroidobacteraceae bacterium]HNS28682.1 2-C-methyl-D-erythritol 2,4-cyclodiphosphate synthase [Steroidobacteraceae bacterium]